MLISVHIPKTGGTSFGELLKQDYNTRVMLDHRDWVGLHTPEAVARRKQLKNEAMQRRADIVRDFDCIHGHFIADKYLELGCDLSFVAFFRDPYQRELSNYYFLMRNPQVDHPVIKIFHAEKMTFTAYLEFIGNIQTELIGTVALDDMAVVGISEEFNRSVELFDASFGRNLKPNVTLNANPARAGAQYPVDGETLAAVKRFRAQDIALYERARELFAEQCSRRL